MRLVRQGSGPAVLFIHGIPTSKRLWDGVVSRLSDRYTCYTLDLPGFGEEPEWNHKLGELAPMIGELERLRAAAGLDEWSVVGHDAGSAIAAVYAHRFNNRVNRLSLISPALFPDIEPFCLFRGLRKPVLGELMAPCMHPLIWRIAMRRACNGSENGEAALSAFEQPFRGPLGPWRMMRLLRWGRPGDVLGAMPSLLADLQTPTLIFHGANDPAIPVSFAHRAASLIKGCTLSVVPDAGHFVPLNRPDAVASGLRRFLTPAVGTTTPSVHPEPALPYLS